MLVCYLENTVRLRRREVYYKFLEVVLDKQGTTINNLIYVNYSIIYKYTHDK